MFEGLFAGMLGWKHWWNSVEPVVPVEFRCPEADFGNVAEPVQANKVFPEWYKRLQPVDMEQQSAGENGRTIKACMPYLDAMSLGYILSVPVEMRVEVRDNGTSIMTGWDYSNGLVTSHKPYQIKGHPREGSPVIKIFTFWAFKTPPGYSSLLTQPFGRTDLPFEAITGVIDTDGDFCANLQQPCFTNLPDGKHIIRKGTPLVQIIPFKRDNFRMKIRSETKEETEAASKQVRMIFSESEAYRKHLRAKR